MNYPNYLYISFTVVMKIMKKNIFLIETIYVIKENTYISFFISNICNNNLIIYDYYHINKNNKRSFNRINIIVLITFLLLFPSSSIFTISQMGIIFKINS